MKSNNSLRLAVLSLTAAATIGVAGCSDTGPNSKEFFTQDDVHTVDVTLERQKTNGAQQDGMLREQHFDGNRLNALGRSKLDRMMAKPGLVTVYLLGTPGNDRHQAILAYAKDLGRLEADVKFVDGLNPSTLHPANEDVSRLKKTELGSTDNNSSDDSSSTNEMTTSGASATGAPTSTARRGG